MFPTSRDYALALLSSTFVHNPAHAPFMITALHLAGMVPVLKEKSGPFPTVAQIASDPAPKAHASLEVRRVHPRNMFM